MRWVYASADSDIFKPDLLPQIHKIDQDSHPIKLARALLICRDIAKKYADKEWARIQDDESWSKMLALLYDSTHRDEHMWVRTGGLDDAWEVSAETTQHTGYSAISRQQKHILTLHVALYRMFLTGSKKVAGRWAGAQVSRVGYISHSFFF